MIFSEMVLEAVKREFSEAVVEVSEPYGFLTIEVEKNEVKKIIHYLKESSLDFNFLTDICGIHYPENQGKELGIVYHLHSFRNSFRLRIKTFFSEKEPEVDTLTDLFAAANWLERETYDFYGIKFRGHPNLKVILNDEELGYHPMLKQYKLEDTTRTDKDDKMFGR